MLAPTRDRPERTPPRATLAPRRSNRSGGGHRVRRIALAAAIIALIPALFSYAKAVTQASNSGLGIRTVEWLRDNGARGLVNKVESIYYSLNAPATGGPGLKALPHQTALGGSAAAAHRKIHYYRPAAIPPVMHPPLPGEGQWHATFAEGGTRPPVLVTSFRPDPNYPQLVAGVAWIDSGRTTTWLYPGRLEPDVPMASRGPEEVPPRLRSRLVATFNSGFKLVDSGGGFAVGGHTYAPLKDGLATIVRYTDGRLDVIPWSYGPTVPANIVFARQNLPLIVNHGRPNPNLSDGPEWGATLGNAVRVWRSAVGVDAHGNLIYAAANYQTVGSLAAIMIRAGAVRAMELDINSYWTSFISYRYPGAVDHANLLADMNRPSDRYLSIEDRDFFAVYTR
jgi:hypothetical protein